MLQGLIGKKLGMTQIFDTQGNVIPVTVLQAGPCVVVQRKTVAMRATMQFSWDWSKLGNCRPTNPKRDILQRPECPPPAASKNSAWEKALNSKWGLRYW